MNYLLKLEDQISNSINNHVHHGNIPRQEVGGGYILLKHYGSYVQPFIEHMDIAEKHNTIITINYVFLFFIKSF